MADQIRHRSVTVPASTSIAAKFSGDISFPNGEVERVDIYIPAGHAGLTGFQLAHAHQPIIPFDIGEFIVGEDERLIYPLEDYPDSGSWQLFGFNLDVFPHTFYVTFLLKIRRVQSVIIGGPAPYVAPAIDDTSGPGVIVVPPEQPDGPGTTPEPEPEPVPVPETPDVPDVPDAPVDEPPPVEEPPAPDEPEPPAPSPPPPAPSGPTPAEIAAAQHAAEERAAAEARQRAAIEAARVAAEQAEAARRAAEQAAAAAAAHQAALDVERARFEAAAHAAGYPFHSERGYYRVVLPHGERWHFYYPNDNPKIRVG